MNRIAASLLCIIVFSCPLSNAFAQANNLQNQLRGTYNFVGVESCISASNFSGSFDPIGGSTSTSNTVKGKVTYDGRGTAVYTATGVTITTDSTDPPPHPPLTTSFTCNFGYVVNPDRTFTLNGYCDGVFTSGASNGQTWSLPVVQTQGIIGTDMQLWSVTEPLVQDVYVGGARVSKRICFGTATLMRSNCEGGRCFGR